MTILQEFGPLLLAMAGLAICSAFFSCSEAALFSLQPDDRRALARGSASQRAATELLARPDRLLMAILFWNLIINMAYFAIASVIGLQLQKQHRPTEAGVVAIVALLAIILFSEMIPKTVGVLAPRTMVHLVGLPLTGAVRLFQPIAPIFSTVNLAARRLFFPNFYVEPYLALSDLEQAITVSTADDELAAQERLALQNIVLLSDLRANELMRPRMQYQTFTPPVSLDDLGGQVTRSGYLLVTEPETDEVVGAIALNQLPTLPRHHLDKFAKAVVYVPWCATVAVVFEELRTRDLEVAAIVNELGETIGIVTLDDLLDTVFKDQASRSSRLHQTSSMQKVSDDLWHVTGITSLRRLSRQFQCTLPKSKSTTVAGIVQEQLGQLPKLGDVAAWHHFQFTILEIDPLGRMTVQLRYDEELGGAS